ncbi:MAG: alanine racemase [Shimia sp.]
MAAGTLTIDLGAIVANWRALDALSVTTVETAACVKADAYGLGAARVAPALAEAGCQTFFVAIAEEGVALRRVLGPGPEIAVFSGHMAGDAEALRAGDLVPMLNAPEQVARHRAALPDHPYGLQLDSGMNRLGIEAEDVAALGDIAPVRVMSHLACADEPAHPMNEAQLTAFRAMTEDIEVPRSLAATGGVLLGEAYHFDMTRPGIGLYGGAPFADATPVVRLSLPVIQVRRLEAGETVGYGNAWRADRDRIIATVSGGYADGLIRYMSNGTRLWAGDRVCPVVGRVSMDLITVDVTETPDVEALDIIGPHQRIDQLATDAGTIGYEILTSLGPRYTRVYA